MQSDDNNNPTRAISTADGDAFNVMRTFRFHNPESHFYLLDFWKYTNFIIFNFIGSFRFPFAEFFKEMLANSKAEFHEMFKRTYGVIYEQNSYVFSDLFNELENYYIRGKVDLAEAMDSFFNTLYQKMFTVLNAQYKFDDK